MKEWYIYVLRDPRTSRVRYVGYTENIAHRLIEHISDARVLRKRCYRLNWLRQLIDLKLEPALSVIEVTRISKAHAQVREKFWIAQFKRIRPDLTNGTEGGDGGVPTEETRKKISNSLKGRKHTPEHCLHISLGNTGKKRTPEQIAVTVAIHKGRKRSAETRQRMVDAKKRLTPEQRKNISLGQLNRRPVVRKCGKCGESGHYATTCGKRSSYVKPPT